MTSESPFVARSVPDDGPPGGSVHRERAFGIEELFFSTTDPRGVIVSGNDVFVRVSGYPADQLIGRPHNVIRHPDMPRAVFRLLWQYLKAGSPIMAYVKNRASDGASYWVAAAARPVDRGFLSVRLKPTTPVFDVVRDVYAEMSVIERDADAGGVSRQAAMDASTAHLVERLAHLGYDGYDAFMRAALVGEVTARREAVRSAGVPGTLARLLDDVGRYGVLNGQLGAASRVLVDIADEGKLLALNAVLASRRLGAGAETLVAVTKALQEAFPMMSMHARGVVDHIDEARRNLDQAGFATALAVLQNDMVTTFHEEVAGTGPSSESDLDELQRCSRADIEAMTAAVDAMIASMHATVQSAAALEADLTLLAAIERNGRIEASRTGYLADLAGLLDSIRDRVADALHHTRDITALAHQLDTLDRVTHELIG